MFGKIFILPEICLFGVNLCNIAKKSIYGYYIRFIIKKIQIDFWVGGLR